MKTYFMDIKTQSGEWVTFVYESDSKKGSFNNWSDLYFTAQEKGYSVNVSNTNDAYIMNEKNKYEQLFGRLKVIDIR